MSDLDATGGATRGPRVAVVADGDDGRISGRPAETLAALAEHGVRGHELVLIADRGGPGERGGSGYRRGGLASTGLNPSAYDLIHVVTPGPAGSAALSAARAGGTPVLATFDAAAPAGFYTGCDVVLSPSHAADSALFAGGVASSRIVRWHPGVDGRRFHPGRYAPELLPPAQRGAPQPTFNVLHVEGHAPQDRAALLAEAFLIAHDRDPRLRLVCAGGGEDALLRARLGNSVTSVDAADRDCLGAIYATVDLLLLTSTTDLVGDLVLEAHASGLPVLAVEGGAAAELIENGRSGCLVPGDPVALGAALRGLARRPTLLERLATGGLLAVEKRSWETSLARLAYGYARALGSAVTADAGPEFSEVARAA